MDMPVFPKRRFQHGAVKAETLRKRVPGKELELRRQFLAMYQG
jgi:asparagine synthase (glutamine-hydrolysing)